MKKYTVRTYVGGDNKLHIINADDVIFKNGMAMFIKHGIGLLAAFPKRKTAIEEIK